MAAVCIAACIIGAIMLLIGFSSKDKGIFKWVWSKELINNTRSNHIKFIAAGFIILGATELLWEYKFMYNKPSLDTNIIFNRGFNI